MFYFSKYQSLRLRLKPSRTTIVNGNMVFEPSEVIQFKDGRYYPTTKKEEAHIDKMIEEHPNCDCKKITDEELAKNKALADELEAVRQKHQGGNKSRDAGAQDEKPALKVKKPASSEEKSEEKIEA